ncbi:MAG TPA: helix-turn-helix domain-containing protein, partial [Terriglobales bacterium]|nr:helix-turn-helix domain-containing protein [Terriglobales bacterium]
ATRKTGAISYLLYTSFPISTNNDVEGLKFENAKPVYFPPQQDRRWSLSGEFGRFSGWNGAVFHDIDGSVGGVRDSYIVIDNGIADDPQHCQIKPDWNAAVCKGDMGRMQIGAGGGGGGARGGAAAGRGAAGPGAPAAPGGRGGFGRGPAPPPIVLSGNGRKFTVSGDTTVLAGTEIRAESEAPSLTISLRELDSGSWVIFELPGYSSAATGTAETSMDALRSATSTSYYRGEKLLSGGVQQVRVVLRAVALLQLGKGVSAPRIAGMVPLTAQAIRKIGHRYLGGGLERALYEKQWPGAEALLEDSEKQRIIAMVCSVPPEGLARWTVRLVAEEAVKRRLVPRVGRETIRVLLLSHDLKPWREKHVVRGRTK